MFIKFKLSIYSHFRLIQLSIILIYIPMNNKISEKVDKFCKISHNISDYLEKVRRKINETPLETLEPFNKYLVPKQRYETLISFYEVYIDAHEKIEKLKQSLQDMAPGKEYKNLKGNLKRDTNRNLKKELEMISIYGELDICVRDLKRYGDIKIVQKLIVEAQILGTLAVEHVKIGFFRELQNMYPRVTAAFGKVASFLLERCDKAEIGEEYIRVVILKLGLKELHGNENHLLEYVRNLKDKMDELGQTDEKIFGTAVATVVTKGIADQVENKIGKYIFEQTLKIDKEGNPENAIFLIDMLSSINKNNIDSLLHLKEEILKVLGNLLQIYFISDEEITITLFVQPSLKLALELTIKVLNREIDKDSLKMIVKKFKDDIEEKTLDFDINTDINDSDVITFVKKILSVPILRIIKYSDKLPEIEKNLYLFNNYFYIQDVLSAIQGESTRELVNKHRFSFFVELRKSIDKSGVNITRKIDKKLGKFQKYRVPEDYRDFFVDEIKKIMTGFLREREYDGGEKRLNKEIAKVFVHK